ncbi:MAG: CDP-alcohol phosphatidyltransferase family protein [Candidatus Latescibacteria bacterium]|nr:CDP-alcohol phosphatidyltransferase family protein [bacterium]MCB9512740.1 CDP-alcohol phosphatidyltransferase family protein [Candidatus Latescibacterota bacterium]
MDRPAVLRSVRRYTTALLLVQTALAALLAWRPGPPRVGAVYLVAALPWTLLVNAVLGRNVHLLYTAEGQPLTRLNLATRVTLIRVLSIPLVGVLVLQGESMMAGLVFLGAAVTDWLDGHLARRMNDVTQLGRIADPSIDALFCGLTFVALAAAQRLPGWLLVLAGIRYGTLLGGALFLKLYAGGVPVRATFLGRLFYFIQYSLLLAFLLFDTPVVDRWTPRALGVLQVLVTAQLLLLGRTMLAEMRHDLESDAD